jgi:hypothetical protein
MNERNTSVSLDEALAKVNPDRRRFLGIMLAGAAAIPLLTASDLAPVAGQTQDPKKEPKAKKQDKAAPGIPPIPTFSPAAGTYPKPQSVTISVGAVGVDIYYTTDGSAPTTSSAIYTNPITVSSTETIKAFGNDPYGSSAVVTATYTITGH